MYQRVLFGRCPLCDSRSLVDSVAADCSKHPLYHRSIGPVMRWQRCIECGHVFTEGHFSDEACKLIYSRTLAHQEVGHGAEQNRVVSSRMIEKVLPYAAGGIWLDVGFGNGSLLFTAEEYGFEPIGVDLRADNVLKLASLGIQAYDRLSSVPEAVECAVVSMADVLEHMPYPKEGLRAAHGLLADQGVLFMSMPNSESAVWKLLDRKNVNPYWGELEHYHNFGRSRLYRLLREMGFEPVRYGISERYRVCMEVIAIKRGRPPAL